jgi:hypothetical protein
MIVPALHTGSVKPMGNPSKLLDCKIRLREDLRRRLDIAAKKRGVYRAQEMVARLERSFDPDPIIELTADVKRLLAMQSEKVDA